MRPIRIALMATAALGGGGDEGGGGDPPPGGTFSPTINISSSGAVVNLRDLANANGYGGAQDTAITFVVPDGNTLSAGIINGVWPGGYTHAPILNIAGAVYGASGAGGIAIDSGGAPGQDGGDAINCTQPMTINVLATGAIKGGGGGGGSGGGWTDMIGPLGEEELITGIGGPGGNGFPAQSAGGAGDSLATGAGGAGGGEATVGTAGAGGSRGGDAVNNVGGTGGLPGYAIRKNGHAVPVTNVGTIVGTAA